MPGVQKKVKHALKILQHFLKDFQGGFNHFGDARHYRVKLFIEIGDIVLQISFLRKKRRIMRVSIMSLTNFVFPKINYRHNDPLLSIILDEHYA